MGQQAQPASRRVARAVEALRWPEGSNTPPKAGDQFWKPEPAQGMVSEHSGGLGQAAADLGLAEHQAEAPFTWSDTPVFAFSFNKAQKPLPVARNWIAIQNLAVQENKPYRI